jgi:hypothetical protein
MAKTSSKILRLAKKQMQKNTPEKGPNRRRPSQRPTMQFNFVEGSLVRLHGRTEGYQDGAGYSSMEGGTVALLVNGPYSTEMTRSGWAVDLLVGADMWMSVEAKRLRKICVSEDDDE